MAGYKGNTNAEKWTKKEASLFVEKVLEYVEENKDCIFIGEPVTALGYYRTLWNYLATKFDFDTIKRVESMLEARLVTNGVNNKTNATMTIFTLKNNYNWTDKIQTDHTSSDGSMTPKAPKTMDDWYNPKRGKED